MIERDNVVVAGDWHANTAWAMHVVAKAADAGCDVILHLGDFGIWPGQFGATYRRKVEVACARHGVTVLVTPGNHEDWSRIERHELVDRGDGWGAVAWFTEHVGILPRGHRFTLAGADGAARTFVSLGGAPSTDVHYRTPWVSWWPGEAITPGDVERVAAGGAADYMLAHDTPEPAAPLVGDVWLSRRVDLPADVERYAAEGRRLLTRAFDAVRPRVLLHGHYHVRDTGTVTGDAAGDPFTCRIESLDMDGTDGNAVVFDVAAGTVAALPV